MKCPLLGTMRTAGYKNLHPAFADCIKEECAWWDKDKDMCSRLSETIELRFIRSLLREIRDKMPEPRASK